MLTNELWKGKEKDRMIRRIFQVWRFMALRVRVLSSATVVLSVIGIWILLTDRPQVIAFSIILLDLLIGYVGCKIQSRYFDDVAEPSGP